MLKDRFSPKNFCSVNSSPFRLLIVFLVSIIITYVLSPVYSPVFAQD